MPKSEPVKQPPPARDSNVKSRLLEVAQKKFNATPQYLLLNVKGPDHKKSF
jgi:dsRNA-specific ribonuclease